MRREERWLREVVLTRRCAHGRQASQHLERALVAAELDLQASEDLERDGVVAAVAERKRVYRVLTTDRRDFGVIRVGARFTKALRVIP